MKQPLDNLRLSSKEYKKRRIKDHNDSVSDKLKELHRGNPKDYWIF